jgi:O-antigen/teichoic acid export membrane protein
VSYVRGFGWNLAFNLVAKIVAPVVALLAMRRLAPDVFGMYAVLQSALVVADAVRDAGVAQVFLRETELTPEVERGYVARSVRLGAGLAVALAVVAWPASRFYGRAELAPGIGCAAAAMFLNGLSTVPYVKLLRRGDFRRAGQAETVASVVSSLFALALVYAGAGFLALAWQLIVRSILFLALTQRWAPTALALSGPSVGRRALRTSRTLTAVNLLWTGYWMGDQALVGKLLGLTAGGLYGSGKMLVQTADVLAKPLMQTANVAFAHRAADPEAVGKTLHKALAAFLLAVAPVYVGVALFSEPLIRVLLPASYHGTAAVLPALCAYGAAIYPGSFAASALLMADRPEVALRGWIATYVGVAALLIAMGTRGSLQGTAWVFAAGLTAVNASTLFIALRQYRPGAKARAGLLQALAALAVTTAFALVLAHSGGSDAVRLALAGGGLPLGHALTVGALTTRNPLSLFQASGVKRLWRRL